MTQQERQTLHRNSSSPIGGLQPRSRQLLRGQSNAIKLVQTFKNRKEEYTQDRKWVNEKDYLKDRAEILDLNEQLKSLGGNVQQLKDELEGPGTYVYKRSEKDFNFLED
ncbi:uncharacterized protein RSE6_08442 [Rhynchosporium secalis]|uniref:Uncharacterized protein n=1 Tax=Rhynchosporium secalis TaxID=38038 RepID=A0A1E1MFE6_RHYSE|nr:uncharacterized protein RSE6_08442 [Rhynchosporium secalis]